jgi:histidinol phosphatase-like PHP family hydrolase
MGKNDNIVKIFNLTNTIKYGAKFFKADLHFHTPASEDARGSNRYNFNPYRIKYPDKNTTQNYDQKIKDIQRKILQDAKKVACDIAHKFIEANLSIVAITDHNGIGTIWTDNESDKKLMDLTAPTWYELIDNEAQKINKNTGKTILTILPGTEISTTGIHILAIFPPQNPRRKIHFIICDLLTEVGFDIEEWGKNPKVGTASVFDTIDIIYSKGGIPILAHIDGSDKAILNLHKINSGAMKNVLKHKSLSAVEIVKPTTFTKNDKKLKKPLKEWIASLRSEESLSPFAYFQGSDAHDLKSIAKRHTFIKMTEPSFSGLQTAIKIPSSRVRISEFHIPKVEGLFIHSVEINNPLLGKRYFRFNRHLNCITGKKGTGKTFIFDLMQSTVTQKLFEVKGTITLFLEKVKNSGSSYYAFSKCNDQSTIQIFSFDPETTSIKEIDKETCSDLNIMPIFYNSRTIEELISSQENLNNFLIKHFGRTSKETISNFNEMFLISQFLEKNESLLLIQKNQTGFKLLVNIQWRTGKVKMKDFFTLSHSIRRTVIMCIIIVASNLGTAIIDAPETHFDNEDIVNYLVPIIKKFKDFQQVILFTNNPIFAINTDPENYILLDSIKTAISGFSIDDEMHRSSLLNILEGSYKSFQKRAERYDQK